MCGKLVATNNGGLNLNNKLARAGVKVIGWESGHRSKKQNKMKTNKKNKKRFAEFIWTKKRFPSILGIPQD